jgi:hypothetical protein
VCRWWWWCNVSKVENEKRLAQSSRCEGELLGYGKLKPPATQAISQPKVPSKSPCPAVLTQLYETLRLSKVLVHFFGSVCTIVVLCVRVCSRPIATPSALLVSQAAH